MTVLIPNKKVAARWNGALETRLRHAPLESFLRSKGRKWVLSGESRVTDNLACATIYFVDQALNECTPDGNGLLDAGMQVIGKPFNMAALSNKVREMIDR